MREHIHAPAYINGQTTEHVHEPRWDEPSRAKYAPDHKMSRYYRAWAFMLRCRDAAFGIAR